MLHAMDKCQKRNNARAGSQQEAYWAKQNHNPVLCNGDWITTLWCYTTWQRCITSTTRNSFNGQTTLQLLVGFPFAINSGLWLSALALVGNASLVASKCVHM
jgi:hypothetical protein